MIKLKVVNRGTRTRYRLGIGFKPNEPVELTVLPRDYLVIKAVRDLDVTILDKDVEVQTENHETIQNPKAFDEEEEKKSTCEAKIDVEKLKIDEVLEAVKEGKISADEAIAQEITGKNRKSLLEKLEELKEG